MRKRSAEPRGPLYREDEDLPEGWVSTSLADRCLYAIGGAWGEAPEEATPDAVKVRVIRGADFRNWESTKGSNAPCRCIDRRSLTKRELRPGDIVLEVSGGGPDQPVGRSVLIDQSVLAVLKLPIVCSNFCRLLRLDASIEPSYAQLALQHLYHRGDSIPFQTQSTNLRNLNVTEYLENTRMPLPPISEQRRIVEKVESLLARVNAARPRLARAKALLKAFRQAILAAACSGKLTEDWRESSIYSNSEDDYLPPVPESWRRVLIAEGCEVIVDCPHSTPKWTESGEICLRTTNFLPGRLDLTEVRYVSPQTYAERVARLEPKPGDVVYSREGGILGIASMIPKGTKACLGQRMMLMRPKLTQCTAVFLMHALNSTYTLLRVKDQTGGSSSPHLNVGDIKLFPILLPPLPEQHEIVRRVEALFALADSIEAKVDAAHKRADALTQAILAKAFRGELVPTEADLARAEGRPYESAAEMLERISAQSKAEPAVTVKSSQKKRAQ